MLNNISGWIIGFSGIIQAITAIGIMVVTIIYVAFTRRMMEQGHSTYLVVTHIDNKSGSIVLANHGNVPVLNVNLYSGSLKDKNPVRGIGKNIILPGEGVTYMFGTTDITDIFVEYRSHVRKNQIECWKFTDSEILFLGED